MAVNNALYILNTYTVDTLTDLVPASVNFTLASLIITNTSASTAVISVNVTDASGTVLAPVLHEVSILANQSKTLELKSLNIPATSFKLMVEVDITGVNFIASGVTIT